MIVTAGIVFPVTVIATALEVVVAPPLSHRVFAVDVLECPNCSRRMTGRN